MTDVYEVIRDDIKSTISNLISHKLIINPYFSDKSCTVNKISSRLDGPKIDKTKSYVENFLKFYNNNEYLFLFQDHSFIQINYEFEQHPSSKRQIVSKANLNYYPNPGLYEVEILDMMKLDIPEEEQVQFWNELKVDIEKDFTYHSNYIRIDYSNNPKDYTALTHPRCHIHIGLNNNFRLATDKLPLLSDFIDLVLFSSYIEDWKKLHKDDLRDLPVYLRKRMDKSQEYIQLTEFDEVLTEVEKSGYKIQII
ncbi:DUF2290 domain-containing protein [Pseudalkalibacillus sp. Hm43]|uniref:DUF2290 domain-containing protein n=1 Tax=Pseudalkalibacillus sp. Hm43 TaxID=3450742 RepID=UPI003F43E744